MLHAREELEMIGLSMIHAKFDSFVASCSGEFVINFRTRYERRPFKLLEVPVLRDTFQDLRSHLANRDCHGAKATYLTNGVRSVFRSGSGAYKSLAEIYLWG